MASQGEEVGGPPSPSFPLSPRAPSPLSFPSIEEKVEEEELAAEESARCPPSPLAHYYTRLTMSDRYAWPSFLGDWDVEEGQPRRVSTGCLGEEAEGSAVQRQVQESFAKDDLAVPRLAASLQPQLMLDLRHVTVRRRDSVCDIEFRFPLLGTSTPPGGGGGGGGNGSNATVTGSGSGVGSGSPWLPPQPPPRPRHLSLSSLADVTPCVSQLTSQSSIPPDWEVVKRRHSCIHVQGHEWVFAICLLVFVSLCLDLSAHVFVSVLVALQAMYYLLLSLV